MFRRFLTILALAALLPACAQGPAADSGAHSRTVTVDRTDAGRVIALHAGDKLLVDLVTPSSMTWRLLYYPKHVLRQDAAYSGQGRFDFTATAAGAGRIALTLQPSCGKEGSSPCTPEGDAVDAVGGLPPMRPVTFDIRVS